MNNRLRNFRTVLNLEQARTNLSEIFNDVIYNFKEIQIGNGKKEGKTASIISTEFLKEILGFYEFSTDIKYCDETNQFEMIIKEIDVTGYGDTKEEAIEMTLDNLEMLLEDYFENIKSYINIENMRRLYPYYLKLSYCEDRKELFKLIYN